jgi:hypothetical protein
MKNYRFENGAVSSIWHVSGNSEECSISVALWKWPSGGRVEREETHTFVPPSLVDHIPSIGVVEAKKNLWTCAFCLKLTAPRENVGGSIQRYFCGPLRLFSRIFVHALHRHRCGRRELDQYFRVRAKFHLLSTFLLQELDQVAFDFTLTRLCWPPSAALCLAIEGTELGRHRRSRHWRRSAAIGGAWPPSAELASGRHLRHSAAIGWA